MPQARESVDGGRQLVERARNGDRDAFAELFRIHHGAVFRVARARLPHALAEDAAAETFARAWVALPRYRPTGAPFASWLYGITRNVAIDMVRRNQRSEPQAEPDTGVVDPWADRDDLLALAAALEALPEEQRQVIELKYLMGLTNDEVGAALGKKPGAVNAQQWRALRALERILGPR
ncbi:MAG: RNA polymerase sigma factor [Acidimicrobiales bacterium]